MLAEDRADARGGKRKGGGVQAPRHPMRHSHAGRLDRVSGARAERPEDVLMA